MRQPLPGGAGRRKDEVIVGFRPEAASDQRRRVACGGEVYAVDMHGAYKLLHVNLGDGR